jgi:hypothetical protein
MNALDLDAPPRLSMVGFDTNKWGESGREAMRGRRYTLGFIYYLDQKAGQ